MEVSPYLLMVTFTVSLPSLKQYSVAEKSIIDTDKKIVEIDSHIAEWTKEKGQVPEQ